jgi:carbonic anhydrase
MTHLNAKAAVTSPEQIWEELMAGNHRFMLGQTLPREIVKRRKELADGQAPRAVILGCSDSRVAPELIFDQHLGDLFVVRSAGNIADAICRGSIEYALEHLGSTVVVVLGHTKCGAVQAACSGEVMPSNNLSAITDRIRPACVKEDGRKATRSSVESNIRASVADLLNNSSIIRECKKKGNLLLVQAIYDLDSGQVVRLE